MKADLVVIGAKGHSQIDRILLGSTSDYVATHSHCSVLVVRPTGLSEAPQKTLKVAVAYDLLDARYTELPRQQRVLYNCQPVYEELPGWGADISKVTSYEDLPKAAKHYVEYVEDVAGIPVTMVSVGPSRAATLHKE